MSTPVPSDEIFKPSSDSLSRVSCVDTVREFISPPIIWMALDWSRLSLTNGALNLGILTRFTFILAINEALSKGLGLRIILRKAALLQDLHGFFHASNSFATLEDFIPALAETTPLERGMTRLSEISHSLSGIISLAPIVNLFVDHSAYIVASPSSACCHGMTRCTY
jgi:hypothetical protein